MKHLKILAINILIMLFLCSCITNQITPTDKIEEKAKEDITLKQPLDPAPDAGEDPDIGIGQTVLNLKQGENELTFNLNLIKSNMETKSLVASSINKVSTDISINEKLYPIEIPGNKFVNDRHTINLRGLKKGSLVDITAKAYDSKNQEVGKQEKQETVTEKLKTVEVDIPINIEVKQEQNTDVKNEQNQSVNQTVTGPTINIDLSNSEKSSETKNTPDPTSIPIPSPKINTVEQTVTPVPTPTSATTATPVPTQTPTSTTTPTTTPIPSPTTTLIWSTLSPMPTKRWSPIAQATNNKIYVIGGVEWASSTYPFYTKNEVYDISGNSWETKAPMPTGRADATSALYDNKIYVFSGNNNANPRTYLNTVEVYDISGNSWETKANIPEGRNGLGGEAINGYIYVMGGRTDSIVTGRVDKYDIINNTWTENISTMPTPRWNFATTVYNNKIYAIGGYEALGGGHSNKVEVYDPDLNNWETLTPLKNARNALSAVTVNGKIYAIGGGTPGNTHTSLVSEFDPVENSWTDKASFNNPRISSACVIFNNIIYLIGGNIEPSPYSTNIMEKGIIITN